MKTAEMDILLERPVEGAYLKSVMMNPGQLYQRHFFVGQS